MNERSVKYCNSCVVVVVQMESEVFRFRTKERDREVPQDQSLKAVGWSQ